MVFYALGVDIIPTVCDTIGMKYGQLIEFTSATFGIEVKTLNVLFRALREAGYLTSGGRGNSAPHMTFVDAANVTLAILSGSGPTKVGADLSEFSEHTHFELLSFPQDSFCAYLEISHDQNVPRFLASILENLSLLESAEHDVSTKITQPRKLSISVVQPSGTFLATIVDSTGEYKFSFFNWPENEQKRQLLKSNVGAPLAEQLESFLPESDQVVHLVTTREIEMFAIKKLARVISSK